MSLKSFFTPLHKRTNRDYLPRMQDAKVHCMKVSKLYDYDYWDGDRRYGYGGYKYDGRWVNVALQLIDNYALDNNSSILDAGCGKAHLLYEIKKILPNINIHGFDFSKYAIENAPEEIKPYLSVRDIRDQFEWKDNSFDLVISLGCIHNLKIFELAKVLPELNRVGKNSYLLTESFRNEQEQFNLQCWALTCESFFDIKEWKWIFENFGYRGDYEFIFFE